MTVCREGEPALAFLQITASVLVRTAERPPIAANEAERLATKPKAVRVVGQGFPPPHLKKQLTLDQPHPSTGVHMSTALETRLHRQMQMTKIGPRRDTYPVTALEKPSRYWTSRILPLLCACLPY